MLIILPKIHFYVLYNNNLIFYRRIIYKNSNRNATRFQIGISFKTFNSSNIFRLYLIILEMKKKFAVYIYKKKLLSFVFTFNDELKSYCKSLIGFGNSIIAEKPTKFISPTCMKTTLLISLMYS